MSYAGNKNLRSSSFREKLQLNLFPGIPPFMAALSLVREPGYAAAKPSLCACMSLSYGRRINEEVSKWNEAAACSRGVIYDRRRTTEEFHQ